MVLFDKNGTNIQLDCLYRIIKITEKKLFSAITYNTVYNLA